MNGGEVHFIRPSVIHLMRGQVFTINGKTSLPSEVRKATISEMAF